MKIIIIAIMLIELMVVSGNRANAQTPNRIQFSKGKSTATVKGTTGSYGITYVVRAKSGQKLILNLTPAARLGIKVGTNGRFGEMVLLHEKSGGTYEVGLEESGDYEIFIGSNDNKPVPFTLTVKIARLTDI